MPGSGGDTSSTVASCPLERYVHVLRDRRVAPRGLDSAHAGLEGRDDRTVHGDVFGHQAAVPGEPDVAVAVLDRAGEKRPVQRRGQPGSEVPAVRRGGQEDHLVRRDDGRQRGGPRPERRVAQLGGTDGYRVHAQVGRCPAGTGAGEQHHPVRLGDGLLRARR